MAHWGPRAETVQQAVDQLMSGLPEKASPEYDAAFKEAIQTLTSRFKSDETFWQATYESIKGKIEQKL